MKLDYSCDIECLATQKEFICILYLYYSLFIILRGLNYYIDYDCNTIIFSLLQNLLIRIDLK